MLKKCPKCKKDYKAGVEAAYGSGLRQGEKKGDIKGFTRGYMKGYSKGKSQVRAGTQRTMNIMAKTNSQLFDELNRLDRTMPIEGAEGTIVVHIKDLERTYNALNKNDQKYVVRKFKRMVSAQRRKIPEIVDKLLCEHNKERKARKNKGD